MKNTNIFFQIIILLNIILIIHSNTEDEFTLQNYLDWCKKNSIIISPKIKLSFENGKLEATALVDLPSKTDLVTIPEKLILTVDNILDLINSPELKSQYESFQNLGNIESYNQMNEELHKDEIFMTYLLYLMKHEKEKYKDTEFYKRYKEFILSIEKYESNTPLFFTKEQKEFISGTYFGSYAKEIRKSIKQQIDILKNSSFYNKEIDEDDFIQKRLFIINRGYDTTQKYLGEIILVPLFTLFPYDSSNNNARLDFNYGKDCKIKTTHAIKRGSNIVLYSPSKENVQKIVLEGKMNTYITNYKENFLIPAFSPYYYYKYDIDDITLIDKYFFNIFDMYFERSSQAFYKKHAHIFKEKNPTNLWICYMVRDNLKYYKDHTEKLMKKVDEFFFGENKEKIEMVNTVLKAEWMELNKKYERMVEICDFEKNKKKEIITEDL